MESTAIEPLTELRLNEIALSAIVAKAAALGRGATEQERWQLYGQAKCAIERFNPTPEEYQRAVALLAEALNI